MNRLHPFAIPVLLAVAGSCWAGGGPYPAASLVNESAKTRAEVVAELREAERLGYTSNVETKFPIFRAADVVPGAPFIVWGDRDRETLLRVKIRAETRMAARFGLLSFGEGDPPIATAEQERLIAAAGKEAVERALVG